MLGRFVGQGGSGGARDWMMLDDAGEAIWGIQGHLFTRRGLPVLCSLP
jgi:hypothetical protein